MSASSRLFGGISPADYSWKEVTNIFRDSADELVLGELLHDANFGLFEAMSAIEMMDPKMDAGMLCNQVGLRDVAFSSRECVSTLQPIAMPLFLNSFPSSSTFSKPHLFSRPNLIPTSFPHLI